jgi:ABC-2 type transport system permease protein
MNGTLRSALVIARRDFTAVILSKTFILFLIGPLFPIIVGVLAGGVGGKMSAPGARPTVGISLPVDEAAKLEAARAMLGARGADDALPHLRRYPPGSDGRALLTKGTDATVMLSGTLARPELTGKAGDVNGMKGEVALMISAARADATLPEVTVGTHVIAESGGARKQAQLVTAQGAQLLLFFLTMLLAGMVLSNMVEEKTNKIIEVLAAAVPVDAIFLGKLMAMLAMSLTGIAIWGACGIAGYLVLFGPHMTMPPPAIGWPGFVALGVIYFATAYTLLGALFIGIGSQAGTVREVQTLSMPVTMMQVVVIFFASSAIDKMGQPRELFACIFPFSSPFAMIARAAQSADVWPHVLAIGWQLIWVGVIVRIGVRLFRRNVLKSGAARQPLMRRLWGRLFRRRTARPA